MSEVPFSAFRVRNEDKEGSVDMGQVVGSCDILFICLDTLRYDAAVAEEEGCRLKTQLPDPLHRPFVQTQIPKLHGMIIEM